MPVHCDTLAGALFHSTGSSTNPAPNQPGKLVQSPSKLGRGGLLLGVEEDQAFESLDRTSASQGIWPGFGKLQEMSDTALHQFLRIG